MFRPNTMSWEIVCSESSVAKMMSELREIITRQVGISACK